MRVLLLLGFLGIASIGCSSAQTKAPFDEDGGAGLPVSSSSPRPPTFADAGGPDGAVSGTNCERDITMGGLTIAPAATCFVNEHVSNQTTTLKFACNGGSATAAFGTHMFTGTVSGNHISLTDAEPFVFNSCDWKSTEVITGDLDTGKVTYSYSEKPVVSCTDTPCTAGGTVTVKAGAVVVVH